MYLSNNVLNLHLRNGVVNSLHGGGKLKGIFCQCFMDQLVTGILGLLFQNMIKYHHLSRLWKCYNFTRTWQPFTFWFNTFNSSPLVIFTSSSRSFCSFHIKRRPVFPFASYCSESLTHSKCFKKNPFIPVRSVWCSFVFCLNFNLYFCVRTYLNVFESGLCLL